MSEPEDPGTPRSSDDYERLREISENLAAAVTNMNSPQAEPRGVVGSVKKINSLIVGLAGLIAAIIAISQAGKAALKKLGIHVSAKNVNGDKLAQSLQREVVRHWHSVAHWRTHMSWWQIILIFVVGMVSIHNSQYGESPMRTGLLCALLIWVLWATTPTWGLVLMVIVAALMVLWMEFL
ncbi:hypothetical protein NE236_36910 [Actinoallomurus purpureus]|uniref:hypothetical protein n=1 Tax=Actinoallomurus purpureus TaxID=478114 RepID=UPI002092ABC9|nr:hypothetical protein [Actinoallomurus purpureus]MCO6010554.1 hypothetical protein [Actinoallomurus purpureus]